MGLGGPSAAPGDVGMGFRRSAFVIFAAAQASCLVDPGATDTGLGSTARALEAGNGLAVNGIGANGLYVNGLAANGLAENGLYVNGLAVNGKGVDSRALDGLAINGTGATGVVVGRADGSTGALTTAQAVELRDKVMPYLAYCALPPST